METVSIRELAHSPAKVIARLRSGPLVVTSNGRPVAALHGVDEDDFLDYVLANAPEFVRDMRRADREIAEGRRGRALEDALQDLDPSPRGGERRSARD